MQSQAKYKKHARLPLSVLALVALTSMQPAHAAFIDHGAYFEDTATGLDWLKLDATVHKTYNQVSADITGGSLIGWSYAMGAQFNALVGQIIGNPAYDGSFISTTYAFADLLIDTFGGPTSGTAEMYAITGNAGGNGHLILGAYAPPSGSAWISGSLGTQSNSTAGNYGSLLIRNHLDSPSGSVPEPGILALLGLGLFGLVAIRRR